MPCYTVRLISVEFHAENEAILKEATRLLGWQYSIYNNWVYCGDVVINLDNHTAEASNQQDINALKRAYSQSAVKAAAKAKGWTLNAWKENTTSKKIITTATKY